MSDTDTSPAELRTDCPPCERDRAGNPVVEVLSDREVPLGGPRGIAVRRTLPQRGRSLIGAWCFADHYGPADVATAGGMDVASHPHTGLQTASWLFSGEVEHRDSSGVHAMVRPGELNLMTAGRGICHSEVSTPATTTLHGVQLWVALPDTARYAPRDFQHYAPAPHDLGGATARVFLGALGGAVSPVETFTPLLGAELQLPPRTRLDLEVDPDFEHGLLVDSQALVLGGTPLRRSQLGYLGTGLASLTVTNATDAPGRALLLGGMPFGEDILMWWNFVGRSHEEIASFRVEWHNGSDRFGRVEGYRGTPDRLPAPPLPAIRMVPRRTAPPGSG
ncbi:MAG: pirin family protein [Mycobacterium sp.]